MQKIASNAIRINQEDNFQDNSRPMISTTPDLI